MTEALATTGLGADIERVIIGGDLAPLNPEQRLRYYNALCESLGLNPLTSPFNYIVLNGKLVLYANKNCAEQIRKIHGVSVTSVDPKQIGDLLVVVASVADREGRTDSSTGAVSVGKLQGEALANAMMKAETKAKRRATLSLCGLGMLDETEVDTLKQQGVASEPKGNNWDQNRSAEGAISHGEKPPTASAQPQTIQGSTQKPAAQQGASTGRAGQLTFEAPDKLTTVIKGTRQVDPPEGVKGKSYLVVTFLGQHSGLGFASCFPQRLWEPLRDATGLECKLRIKEADKDGSHFINITDLLEVDGTPIQIESSKK